MVFCLLGLSNLLSAAMHDASTSLQALIIGRYAKKLLRNNNFEHFNTYEDFESYLIEEKKVPKSIVQNSFATREHEIISTLARFYFLRMKRNEKRNKQVCFFFAKSLPKLPCPEALPDWLLEKFAGVSVQDLKDYGLVDFEIVRHASLRPTHCTLRAQNRSIGSLYGINNLYTSEDLYTSEECYKDIGEILLFGNLLTEIPNNIFAKFVNLMRIDVSSNRITRVKPNSFSGSDELFNILLAGNPITRVSPKSFAIMPYLSNLNLIDTKLSADDRTRIIQEVTAHTQNKHCTVSFDGA